MRASAAVLTIVAVFSGVHYACSKTVAGSESGVVTAVSITTEDYAFTAPDTIPAGFTRIRLTNAGKEFHHVQLVRIEEGHVFEEYRQRAEAGEVMVPWVTPVGGPNVPPFTGASEVMLDVEPGQYALICLIPASDRKPHFMKGMVQSLTVVEADRPEVAEPDFDVRVMLDDYMFVVTPKLTPGRKLIRVENRASQAHEFVLMRLAEGKHIEDVMAFLGTMEGTPPFELVAGVTEIAQGVVNFVVADLEPGNYALLCFARDDEDGRSHIEHGMTEEFRVV